MSQNIRKAENVIRSIPEPGGQTMTLPVEGKQNTLITSALPYCNNVPHLGNIIGSTLSADVYSRYARTRDRPTLYICGTDEYGTATETQALKDGVTPRELCDKYHLLHKATYEWFNIGFDHFGRTSTPLHTEICQEIYLNLEKNNLLEKQQKELTYCEGCNKFLADRFVEGTCPHCGYDDARGDQCDGCSRTLDAIELINPRCLVNKTHKIVARFSFHMYFKMDTVQPRTEKWLKNSYKEGRWGPNNIINTQGEIVDVRLKTGLRPTPVTRDLTWGVPVPVAEDGDSDIRGKVLYVWFDAPIGYPSITANYSPEWRQWWFNQNQVKLFQFMGKDNAYFHSILFPSMELGDGRPWTMLHHLSTTEYLNYEGGKFSKSRNRGVFGPQAKETGIPASVWRYYLLSARPETADSMFSWVDCIAANNNVLLKNFGNFVNRTLMFASAMYKGVVPDASDESGPISPNDPHDAEFVAEINALITEYTNAMEGVKLRLGLQIVMQTSARGNLYLQASGLGKVLLETDPKRCASVILRAINLIYVLSVMVYPYMPGTSQQILDQLNAPPRSLPDVLSVDILPGHTLGKPEHLFKKIEESSAEIFRAKYGGVEGVTTEVTATQEPVLSKRKQAAAAKAAKAAAPAGAPKSAAALKIEEEITKQGTTVRTLKAVDPRTTEIAEQIDIAVGVLKKLKEDLAAELKK